MQYCTGNDMLPSGRAGERTQPVCLEGSIFMSEKQKNMIVRGLYFNILQGGGDKVQ